MQIIPYILCLAVTGGVAWVYEGTVYSRAARHGLGDALIQLYAALLSITVNTTIFLLGPSLATDLSSRTLVVSASAMTLCGAMNFCMLKAMTRAMTTGPNGAIWSVTQSGMLLPFLMGIVFFGVEPRTTMLTGCFLIIASIVLLGIGKQNKRSFEGGGSKWFLYALLAFLFCGLNQCFGNMTSYIRDGQRIPSAYRVIFIYVGVVLMWAVFSMVDLLRRGQRQKTCGNGGRKHLKSLLYAASMLMLTIPCQTFLFYRGLDGVQRLGYGSIGFPVAVCSCILGFLVYSIAILRERQTTFEIVGGLLAAAGVFIICL